MSVVGQYAIKLTALAIVITLSRMLLPDGKMKQTVNTVFSLLLILTLITPLLNLKDIEIEKPTIQVNSFEKDEEFLNYVNVLRVSELNETGSKALKDEGIDNTTVSVECVFEGASFYVKKVAVDLKNAVISTKLEHININEITKEILSQLYKIEKEAVWIE